MSLLPYDVNLSQVLIKITSVKSKILLCLLIRKMLRRNPIGNKQFLVFSGPDRIFLGTLQFFLRFLKANDIDSCLK